MAKTEKIKLDNVSIEGFSGDYVFETIKKTNDYYEGGLLKKWLPYISSSKIVLDIGANLGNHTLFWANHLSYDKIFSFEPYRPNYERLYNNIKGNGIQNIYPICKGVGDKIGFTGIAEFHEDNYGGTTLNRTVSDTEGDIRIVDIDSFVAGTGLAQVDFIKIDTEGFELNVLSGMRDSLLKFYPDIWIEVSANSFSSVMEILSEPEYVLSDVDGFNMLFLNRRRHQSLNRVSLDTVLNMAFYNLERVNLYYKNYITAKEWISSKNDVIASLNGEIESGRQEREHLRNQLKESNEKYKDAMENYNTAKEWLFSKNETISSLQEKMDSLQAERETLRNQLNECNEKYKKSLENYSTLKGWFENLQKERDSLKAELEAGQQLRTKMEEQLLECVHDYDFNISNMEQLSRILTRLEIQNSSLSQKNSEQKAVLDKIDHNFFGRLAIRLYHLYQKIFRK